MITKLNAIKAILGLLGILCCCTCSYRYKSYAFKRRLVLAWLVVKRLIK